jgi:RHS repeat-associated protein
MALASGWVDLVVGMDMHLHLVPTPAGPVPTPLPQPYVGLVGHTVNEIVSSMFGPMKSLLKGRPEAPAGLVLINGMPATTTITLGMNLPLPHVPMPPGTAYVNPPDGEASFPMGALKIAFRGASAVRMGDMAMSCSDPIPMPTSRVVAIPKGVPVMIDGAPGLSVDAAIARWAASKLLRAAFREAIPTLRTVARLSGPRLRNLVGKARCFVAGHPVDVATGRVFTDAVDFSLPGPIPLVFERSYFSSWSHRDGPLGRGWSHSLDLALWFEGDLAVFRNGEGQEIVFVLPDGRDSVEIDQEVFEALSGDTLVRARDGWRVITARGIVHRFARVGPVDGDVWRVVRTTGRNPQVGLGYAYDAAGRLVAVNDCGGRIVKLQYDGQGRLAQLLGPHPTEPEAWVEVAGYAYTADGLLAEARDALGHPTRYAYDGGLMVEETDRNGVAFFWVYDGRGSGARCVRTWGLANGEAIHNQKLDYDAAGGTTLVTDSYGAKTLYKVNALGGIVEIIDALGGRTIREYDEALRLTAETDPLGNRTVHHYGTRGQLVTTVFPDGARVVMKHDPRRPELVTLRVDEMGAAWRYRYDSWGQLLEERGPEPDAWQLTEWEGGLVAAVVGAGGARTEVLERDRWGEPVLVRLPSGAHVRRELDRRGRVVATVDERGARRTFAYDAADRVVGVGEPDGNVRTITRDPLGSAIEVADRRQVTRFTYADANKLASRETGGAIQAFVHGREGELRAVRNENGEDHRFVYDPCLRVEREIGFDRRETRLERNAAGWTTKVTRTGAGIETTYGHDARGRVVAAKHSDGTWARYVFRKDGALIEATNHSATVRFVRDALGRVGKEIQDDVEVSSFYACGFRSRVDSSLGARMVVARDLLGNPTSIALGRDIPTGQVTFQHDPGELETGRALPGGVAVAWQRDASGRPARQDVTAGGRDVFAREYAWGVGDRLAQIADSRFGVSTFERDARGRLVGERRGDQVRRRDLDAAGNVGRGEGAAALAFDAAGNVVRKTEPGGAAWTYAWDSSGMLTEVVAPDGRRVRYAYDALGRRIRKSGGDVDARWIWDGDVILHELCSDRPPTTWYHEPESFTPLAKVTRAGTYHVVPDQIGAPTALFDGAGALAWQMQLDLFGVAQRTGSDPPLTDCPLRWPGQYRDDDTGLHYNRFRYYDPSLGQYLTPDPLGLVGGGAVYSYVDDPTVLIDPCGLVQMDPQVIRSSQRTGSDRVRHFPLLRGNDLNATLSRRRAREILTSALGGLAATGMQLVGAGSSHGCGR